MHKLLIYIPFGIADHVATKLPYLHPDFTIPFREFQGFSIPADETAVLTHIALAKAVERQLAYIQPSEGQTFKTLSDSWKKNVTFSPYLFHALAEDPFLESHLRLQFYASLLDTAWTHEIASRLEEENPRDFAYLIEVYGCRPLYLV